MEEQWLVNSISGVDGGRRTQEGSRDGSGRRKTRKCAVRKTNRLENLQKGKVTDLPSPKYHLLISHFGPLGLRDGL